MGEAKRRKQLDASYGQGRDISNSQSFARHVGKLFFEADEIWTRDLRAHGDFKQADKTLTDWMQQQLSCFKAQDRPNVATALINLYLEAGARYMNDLSQHQVPDLDDHHLAWGRMFHAIAKASEPWLPEEIKQELDTFLEPLLYEEDDDINEGAKVISAVEPQS